MSGDGWKGASEYPPAQALITFCKDKSGDKLINCVEDNVYTAKDIFMADFKFKPMFAVDSNQSVFVQYYGDNYNGLAQVLYPEPGLISKQMFSTLQVTLNNTLFYYIMIGDPKIMLNTLRPDTVPITLIKLEKGTGQNILFLKVK